MFKRLDEGSHLLKHYLIYHQDIPREEMKFGMRVRNVFKTSLERQVGEAVAIDYEMRLGKTLMNSKSEYNRCTLPRIVTRNPKEHLKEIEGEKAAEEILKKEIRKLRIKRREDMINKEMKNIDMKRAILEIQNDNIITWKENREKELIERENIEKVETEILEREQRLKVAEGKRREFIRSLKLTGKMDKEKKGEKWIEENKSLCREYRGNNSLEGKWEILNSTLENSLMEGNIVNEENREILVKIKEGKLKFGVESEVEGKVIRFGGKNRNLGQIEGKEISPPSEIENGQKSHEKVPICENIDGKKVEEVKGKSQLSDDLGTGIEGVELEGKNVKENSENSAQESPDYIELEGPFRVISKEKITPDYRVAGHFVPTESCKPTKGTSNILSSETLGYTATKNHSYDENEKVPENDNCDTESVDSEETNTSKLIDPKVAKVALGSGQKHDLHQRHLLKNFNVSQHSPHKNKLGNLSPLKSLKEGPKKRLKKFE